MLKNQQLFNKFKYYNSLINVNITTTFAVCRDLWLLRSHVKVKGHVMEKNITYTFFQYGGESKIELYGISLAIMKR